MTELKHVAQNRLAGVELDTPSRQVLANFIDQAPVAIAMFDRSMHYIALSERWRHDYRLSGDILGRSHYDVFPEMSDTWKDIHRRAMAGEVLRAARDAFRRPDGSIQWLTWEVRPWYDKSKIGGIIIFAEDLTDRTKADEALRESEERFRAIVDTALEAIIVIDNKGIMQSVNPAAEKLFGYSLKETTGKSVNMLMPAHIAEQHDGYIENYLRTGERKIIGIGRAVTAQRKDGSHFPIELTVAEATAKGQHIFVGFIRDLTQIERESKRADALQSELLHVSRLSEMGHVASNLAHEVNQPLTAILNYARAYRRIQPMDESSPTSEMVAKIEAQAERATGIIKRLRGFIEKRESDRYLEDLRIVVEEALGLALVGTVYRDFHIDLDLSSKAFAVEIDRIQIQQVMVNFIRNAADAMTGISHPAITIRSEAVGPQRVRVMVSDVGPGVDPAITDKLFMPFTTTKEQGMGIGLSICKSIIESHGGEIGFLANPKGGASFFFTLPLVAAAEQHKA